MRRFANALAVLVLAVSLTTTTAHAAPRRDAGDGYLWRPLQKIVELVKKVVRPLDGGEMTFPKP